MTLALTFDLLLAFALLWSAWRALAAPDATRAVLMFVVFGLLLTLVWGRLDAPDIALAEAAIGAGLTGALLLDALAVPGGSQGAVTGRHLRRWSILALAPVLTAGLVMALLALPRPSVDLPAAVTENMARSGVAHPVTAVLLNFRGYDTLLEVAVLLAALFGVLAVTPGQPRSGAPGEPLLRTLARLACAPMIVVAGYLLWAGAHQPGGAFQAAAVLAAAAVLLHLAGLMPAWTAPRPLLRLGLAGGLLVFLAVAVLPLAHAPLLTYPTAWAGALILLVEAALTVSLGLVLAGLFLFLTRRAP